MFGLNKKKACESCVDYSENQKAHSPKKLSSIISVVKSAVKLNHLVPKEPNEKDLSEPFELLSIDPPWPDIIHNEFCCPSCKSRFKLVANTYQGGPKNGWFKL